MESLFHLSNILIGFIADTCMYVYARMLIDGEGASTATTGTDGHTQAEFIITAGSSEAKGGSDCSERERDDGACFGSGLFVHLSLCNACVICYRVGVAK